MHPPNVGAGRAFARAGVKTDSRVLPPQLVNGETRSRYAQICILLIGPFEETPENWTVYRKPDCADQAWIDLCASGKASGIQNELGRALARFVPELQALLFERQAR